MSGNAQIWVQPCTLLAGGKLTPGYPDSSLAATNLPGPNNMVSASPPTLLEVYEVYAISIAWGLQFADNTQSGVQINAQLRLLLDDRLAYSSVDSETVVNNVAVGQWVADLVNPIRVEARDRLALQLFLTGVMPTPASSAMIGAQPQGGSPLTGRANWLGIESTISYAVLDMPASRKL